MLRHRFNALQVPAALGTVTHSCISTFHWQQVLALLASLIAMTFVQMRTKPSLGLSQLLSSVKSFNFFNENIFNGSSIEKRSCSPSPDSSLWLSFASPGSRKCKWTFFFFNRLSKHLFLTTWANSCAGLTATPEMSLPAQVQDIFGLSSASTSGMSILIVCFTGLGSLKKKKSNKTGKPGHAWQFT